MTTKQYYEILDAIYGVGSSVVFVGLLISVQLSGWDSWESIWLTVAVGLSTLVVPSMRKYTRRKKA